MLSNAGIRASGERNFVSAAYAASLFQDLKLPHLKTDRSNRHELQPAESPDPNGISLSARPTKPTGQSLRWSRGHSATGTEVCDGGPRRRIL